MTKLTGLPAKFYSTGFRRNDWNPTGIGGALIRPRWQLLATVVTRQHRVVFDDGGGCGRLWLFLFMCGCCLSLLVIVVGIVAFVVWAVVVGHRVC